MYISQLWENLISTGLNLNCLKFRNKALSLGASFTNLTYVSDTSFVNFILPYTHNLAKVKQRILWYILNENRRHTFPLSVLFLGLKFYKILEFSLSEHCE
jgi:hypothetical protein